MNIYIIDDEPKIRRGLQNIIAAYRPTWPVPGSAGDAESALEDPAFWKADLVFLDIQLPGMDGLSLLQIVRELHSPMQVIIISGYADFTFAQKAIALQVRDYLLKPIEVDRVFTILDSAEQEFIQATEETNEKETVRQNLHSLRESFFIGALFGKERYDVSSYAAKLGELGLDDTPFLLCSLRYANPNARQHTSIQQIQTDLLSRVNMVFPDRDSVYLLYIRTGIIIILTGEKDLLQEFSDTLCRMHDADYRISTSEIHIKWDELSHAYEEALAKLDAVSDREGDTDHTLYIETLLRDASRFHPSVGKAIAFIQENYASQLSLTLIASSVHLHTTYLSELFKRETGCNLSGFINDYRIHVSKQKLRDTDELIGAIGEAVGFSDYHYFSQVFSKRVGVSPRQYRLHP